MYTSVCLVNSAITQSKQLILQDWLRTETLPFLIEIKFQISTRMLSFKIKIRTLILSCIKILGKKLANGTLEEEIFYGKKILILVFWLKYAVEPTSFYMTVCIFLCFLCVFYFGIYFGVFKFCF